MSEEDNLAQDGAPQAVESGPSVQLNVEAEVGLAEFVADGGTTRTDGQLAPAPGKQARACEETIVELNDFFWRRDVEF